MRRLGGRLALALLGVLVALVGAELVARRIWTLPDLERRQLDADNSDADCVVPSPTRGWTAAPDVCDRDGGGRLPQRANDKLPDDAPVALLLGDSVSYREVWVDRTIDRSGMRILNHGMSGYNPCQEADLLRELGPQDVDHLLLQLAANDLGDTPAVVPYPGGVRLHVDARTAVDVPHWAMHSDLALYALFTWGVRRERHGVGDDVAACLGAFAAYAEAQDIPLTVIQFPALHDTPTADELELKALVEEAGLDLVYLRPVLEALDPDAASWREHDRDWVHPNPRASDAVGAHLGEYLAER